MKAWRLAIFSAAMVATSASASVARADSAAPAMPATPATPPTPSTESKPPVAETKPDDEGRSTLLPVLSSSPETSLMLGGVALYHFRVGGPARRTESGPWARRSSVGLFTAYTLKNQFLFSLWPSLYLQGETWHLRGSLDGLWFPNTFYEIGRDSRASSAEDYDLRVLGGAVVATRKVVSSFRVGLRITAAHSRISGLQSGGLLASGLVPGAEGGLIVGFGPTVSWDDRDRENAPGSGSLYQLSATFYPGALGSDYQFALFRADARRYIPLRRDHVLAVQAYAQYGAGDVPFQSMAQLSGTNRLRGYFASRYIDLHMISAQAEYRLPLFWKLGGAVFAGLGDVAAKLGEFDLLDPKFAGGVGLRYALNPSDRVNLRVDLAATREADLGFYISLGEAF